MRGRTNAVVEHQLVFTVAGETQLARMVDEGRTAVIDVDHGRAQHVSRRRWSCHARSHRVTRKR